MKRLPLLSVSIISSPFRVTTSPVRVKTCIAPKEPRDKQLLQRGSTQTRRLGNVSGGAATTVVKLLSSDVRSQGRAGAQFASKIHTAGDHCFYKLFLLSRTCNEEHLGTSVPHVPHYCTLSYHGARELILGGLSTYDLLLRRQARAE